MHDIFESIIRTILSYIMLLLFTYFMGKQLNSHKNYFNFAFSITLGSFVANMSFEYNLNYLSLTLSFLTLILIYFILLLTSFHSRNLRKYFSGRPTVIIEKGKLLDHNMKKLKYSLDNLNQHLREQSIFDIDQVEYAVLEVSGNLSVLKKDIYQTVVKKDMSIPPKTDKALPVEVIMEGKIIKENLRTPYTKEWIEHQCRSRNLLIQDVYYAVIGTQGQLFFDVYNDRLKSPFDVE
ncbi:DUF421 domain-containing protein [Falsibacillus albus]|uniref:DUF421 domain-containing protein n=1 Tax=Falsibacillus albus TaxID=2478915 RepID=A0A3L7JZE8_9BACI|nr:DUF421 domain-containing protein [Falsibacillus albus]RLQ96258.1 DUF421 domain-containing protein [Falsibacillus albus]